MNAGGPHRRSSDDEESIINRRSAAVIACIAVAVIVGAACAFMFLNNGEDDSYKVTYFKKGKMVSEETVPAGTYVTIIDGIGADDDQERFIGWNTRSDMSGSTLLPGTLYRVDRSISLHAMAAGSEMFAIILPEKKEGFNITADPMMVVRGGSSIISYSLEPSHVDDDLVIFVNGNPMKLDAMKRIHLTDINEDKIVTVTGIYDRREHSISLPDDQRGYVLTSSAEKVHHGESYTLEFKLLPGYAETQEFGIHVNGGDAKRPSEGTVLIEDVRDNHVITVTGVEPIRYDISAGRNVLVFVNGAAASKATVEDTVTIQPADGYSVPETFNAQIKGKFTVKGNGYKVTDNIVFPSILKITAGDNIRMNGGTSKFIFVCPDDKVKLSPSPGYSLPENYVEKAKGLSGVRYSADGFLFSDDTVLPSIYKVVFNGYSAVFATFFVVGGTTIPFPQDDPKRVAYYFNGWKISPSLSVTSDLSVESAWGPMTHQVFFGPNLLVTVGNVTYSFKEGGGANSPRTIEIKSDEKVVIENTFDLPLPNGFGPHNGIANYKNGYFEIIENCSFPGITYIAYMESGGKIGLVHTVIIGSGYTPIPEPMESKDGYVFAGWMEEGVPIIGQIKVENRPYVLYADWKPADG